MNRERGVEDGREVKGEGERERGAHRLALEDWLPQRDRHILVLDHVLYLSSQGHDEQREEVEDEDRPEDGDVEDAEKGRAPCEEEPAGDRVPALELGESPDKWLELGRVAGRGRELRLYDAYGNVRRDVRVGACEGSWRAERAREKAWVRAAVWTVDGRGGGGRMR